MFSTILFYLTMMTLFTLVPNLLQTFLIICIDWGEQLQKRIDQRRKRNQSSPISIIFKYFLKFMALFYAKLLELYAWIMHSHEIIGMENIPSEPKKAALIIGYHGILPTDLIFLYNKIYLKYQRFPRAVGDRFLFPFGNIIKNYLFTGPASKCIEVLSEGHLLVIAPGGTREAQFATKKYETIWNNRCGFARVAKEANVDIIPVFTKNVRQVYLLPEFLQKILRNLYEKIRMPVVPFLGGFPVKLITYVGKPIKCNEAETPEELALIVQKAVDELIRKYQKFPATIFGALQERFIPDNNQIHKSCDNNNNNDNSVIKNKIS